MPEEILSRERALKDLFAPKEIFVDQNTARRLDQLCSEMTDACGFADKSKRVAYIKTALNLSARGTRAIKMFLSEWSVVVEESKSRENSRSAKDSTIEEHDLALPSNALSGNSEK